MEGDNIVLFIYNFTLTKKQALELNIKLEEPIVKASPPSTPWEAILTDDGEIYILPELFCKTEKFNWILNTGFKWRAKIKLNRPLDKDCFFIIDSYRPLKVLNCVHTPCLKLVKGKATEGCLKWNPKYKDIRS